MRASGADDDRRLGVTTYLAAMLDKLADFNSVQCTWNYTGGRGVKNSFSLPTFGTTWDFAETNPFNPAGASWAAIADDIPAAIESLVLAGTVAPIVRRGSSTHLAWPAEAVDAVITDPPYYDNVPYADISDFFYVWLKRTVGHLYPDHFSSDATAKRAEAVADAVRHGGDRLVAKRAYEQMMGAAFNEAGRLLKPLAPMAVVYAHKTTLGWSTLVDGLRSAGFEVTEAWPLDTEMKGRVRAMNSAALASSIFLIARKRRGDVGVGNKDALVEKKKAKYRARDFTERGDNDKLGMPGGDGKPVPLIDSLHRVLWLMENRPRKLAEFLTEAGPDRERLRVLAQALAGAALSGKAAEDAEKLIGTTAAEKAALGKRLANWRSVVENAVVPREERAERERGQKRLFD